MRRIRLRLPDASVEARLLEDAAPRASERLWRALPLRVQLRSSRWSGETTFASAPILSDPADQASRVHVPRENARTFMLPGHLYTGAFTGGIGLAYGEAQSRDVGLNTWTTDVAEFVGDSAAFLSALARVRRAGATDLLIERVT